MKKAIPVVIITVLILSVGGVLFFKGNHNKQNQDTIESLDNVNAELDKNDKDLVETDSAIQMNDVSDLGNAKYNNEGEVVANPSNMDIDMEVDETPKAEEQEVEDKTVEVQEEQSDYTVETMDEKTMYAVSGVNLRQGPDSVDYDKVGALSRSEAVTVVGVVNQYKGEKTLWYQIKDNTGFSFVSGKYLADNKPAEVTVDNTGKATVSNGQSPSQNTPEMNAFLQKVQDSIDSGQFGGPDSIHFSGEVANFESGATGNNIELY